MNKLEQAARQALEVLEYVNGVSGINTSKAITALREALAEQVHTPYCKQAPMCKTPCGNSDCVEQAEQEPKELVLVLAGFDRSKYTKEQWDWCLEYLSITDYEPMMCDFEYGTHTFYEAVQASVQWYEDHTSDMHLKISRTVGKFDPEKEVDYD